MKKRKVWMLLTVMIFMGVSTLFAAEVENVRMSQEGNRIKFLYDIASEAGETEAEVNLTITLNGRVYKHADLHLDGAFGKVTPGKGKTLYWNVLQEFPRGLDAEFKWDLSAGGGKVFTDKTTGMDFIFVKGGCFQMGDVFGDGFDYEKPVHEACVGNFYMGKYEVTQGQWKQVMGSNPSYFSSCGDGCPVENMSWNDAQTFIEKLNRSSGKKYRLPTEAEWEYAARSGGKKEKWAGTTSESSLGSYAWYSANSGSKTHPVGQKQPNGLGLYDMTGNVWEWCSDWYANYSSDRISNPVGASSGSDRVYRGGSWSNYARNARASDRHWSGPGDRGLHLGLRLVVPPGH